MELLSAMLGGFLAAGTGWLLQIQIERQKVARIRKFLSIAIADDLEHSLNIYDRIEDEWSMTSTIWFSSLNELRESRAVFINNKDSIISFNDQKIRRRIFKYYLKSSELIGLLDFYQRRRYELQGKFNDMVTNIKINENGISEEKAKEIALSIMHQEDEEFKKIENAIPETIKKLLGQKLEATELMTSLKMKRV
jgi:hypothetical protein